MWPAESGNAVFFNGYDFDKYELKDEDSV